MGSTITIEKAKDYCEQIIQSVSKVFVGDAAILEKLLASALANGHVLFEDYPGLGKTLLVKVFTRVIGCNYGRIQFTPDLLPADIIGGKVWRPADSSFELVKGPVFTNILLADEINRTPPKTQAALLEAMQERKVTIEGETHRLEMPFFVLATQNPIEQEGTYPLPEAQLDRFLMKISVGYPVSDEAETLILERRIRWRDDDPTADIKPVITAEDFLALQALAENDIYIDRSILEYISRIIRATREHPLVDIGSSPRGGLNLLKVSRCLALIRGRDYVIPDDVKMVVQEVLSHRVILIVEEMMEGTRPSKIIEDVMEQIPAPLDYARKD
ncbi:MAG: MoxR family ATPase [Dehalococcoidales bacterium]|nr:MoxR family ATPase [Dehalococcoidales bacterium]